MDTEDWPHSVDINLSHLLVVAFVLSVRLSDGICTQGREAEMDVTSLERRLKFHGGDG